MTIDEIKRQMFIDSEEVCGNTMIDTYKAQEYIEQAYNKVIDECLEIVKFHKDTWDGIEWAIKDLEALKERERD